MDTAPYGDAEHLGVAPACSEFAPASPVDQMVIRLRAARKGELAAVREQVSIIAEMRREAVFAENGQRPATAVAALLGIEPRDARRLVRAAEAVEPRIDLTGQVLDPELPATSQAFAAGSVDIAQVDVVSDLMSSRPARRLAPHVWAEVETQLAAVAPGFTPTEIRRFGQAWLDRLDQDGDEPEDGTTGLRGVNELHLTRRCDGGGMLKGRFDDPALFGAIATVIEAKAAPLTGDDDRTTGERRAEALAEIAGLVMTHGDSVLPDVAGARPQVVVTIALADLEHRARAAMLDDGRRLTAAAARQVCCDATVIPVVLGGTSQPLEVGRATRTIPDGLRRAVTTRDGGCAHPGCDRPPSWSQIHHIHEWARGGPTRLDNVVMLCRVHHREIHSSEWAVRMAADGHPEFIPPRWIDPTRAPRRRPHPHAMPAWAC